jgi:hypothetical protein
MNTLKLLRITAGIFTMLYIFSLYSCGKKDETTTKQEEKDKTEQNEFTESNEDLLKVDYDYFYKELSPHGEWVEINAKDIGIDIKPGTTINEGSTGYNIAIDLLGIKTAYAQTDEQLFNIFVWRPANELVKTMVDESPDKEYAPYNNGEWIYTDRGWYFKASTPQEDLTSHYGRWTQDPELGWVWLPGKVWSPAWVDWRENEDHVGWAPLPPGTYINNNSITQYNINDNRYTIVEKKHFIEPGVYKYRYQYVENKNKIMIKEMTKKDGIMIKDKVVINKGPEVGAIETKSGKKIKMKKIKNAGSINETGVADEEISVFSPGFKTVKESTKEPVTKPGQTVSYKDAKKISKEKQDILKAEDKQQKQDEKEIKKEDKDKEKQLKKEDKENKKEDKEIKKEDKGNKKENEQKDPKKNDDKSKGNDKDKKSNDDKGKKNK